MEVVGQVISGEYGEILIRQKSGKELELGELLVSGDDALEKWNLDKSPSSSVEHKDNSKTLLQVFNLVYGSQIEPKTLELLSGMSVEGYGADLGFMEANLRNYVLAQLKSVVTIDGRKARMPKSLPRFFSGIRRVEKGDLDFLEKPSNPLFVGNVRSGSKDLGIAVNLNGREVLSHHVLIPATTGRGKSNLLRVILWSLIDNDYCGLLILDPHDEYYGRNELGIKDHTKSREKVSYYSLNPVAGAKTLVINYRELKPWFFQGVMDFSPAQRDAMYAFYKKDNYEWIKNIITADPSDYPTGVKEESVGVLARKLSLIGISSSGNELNCEGVFSTTAGETLVNEICSDLERARIVIVDTSSLSGETELLVSSILASRVYERYRRYKASGELRTKPVVSIILEEAPRLLGKDVLQAGPNIFSTIAREGRKFQVGLVAITQLPSLIPREILANMNTKIILGIEMEPERNAIIESASQDLSKDGRNIAALDKGEALITSNFTKFAIPVFIPLFDKAFVSKSKTNESTRQDFSGFR